MYGANPSDSSEIRFVVFDETHDALDGLATRKQVRILWEGVDDGVYTDILIYYPNDIVGKVPVLVGLNFEGNQTISSDPEIMISKAYAEGPNFFFNCNGVIDNHATELSRGSNSDDWPLDQILHHGYGIATAYREEVASDHEPYFTSGIHIVYPELQRRNDNFGTIAAWAWSLSRIVDFLETEENVDTSKICAFGFSRLGKAALWAAAQDERFTATISQMSGAGGAKLFRRFKGENITRLNCEFPHWFCQNFKKYMSHDDLLPYDMNEMMALIAPRALYVSSALDDKMSDPEGEYQGLIGALPVYYLYTTSPKIGYHVRPGGHDVLSSDWECYLGFLDMIWK